MRYYFLLVLAFGMTACTDGQSGSVTAPTAIKTQRSIGTYQCLPNEVWDHTAQECVPVTTPPSEPPFIPDCAAPPFGSGWRLAWRLGDNGLTDFYCSPDVE